MVLDKYKINLHLKKSFSAYDTLFMCSTKIYNLNYTCHFANGAAN